LTPAPRGANAGVPTSPTFRRIDMGANTLDGGHLKSFIERIERLEEEKKAIADDIKDIYAEAKGTGYDVKIMRKIVSIRKQDAAKRREEEEILDLYLSALGQE
jgi:uncharacterized protein (UPF0335 family)